MVVFGAATDTGRVRDTNQDAGYLACADTSVGELCLAVVCDGVGGLSYGEVASSAVAQGFASWFHTTLPQLVRAEVCAFSLEAVETSWRALLGGLNADLYEQGVRGQALRATTCTAVLVYGGGYVACQVGDSRLYRVSEGACVQLTADQTLAASREAQGAPSAEAMPSEGERHVILQAIGAACNLSPEFSYGPVDTGDLLVVCTDGAYRRMDTEGMHEMFAGPGHSGDGSLDAACRALVDACLDAGETDNLTALCMAPYGWQDVHHDTLVVR